MLKDTCLISYSLSNSYLSKNLMNSTKGLIDPNHIYIKDDSKMSKLYTDDTFHVHSKKRRLNHYKNKLMLLKHKYNTFIVTDCDCRFFCSMGGWTELYEFMKKSEKQIFFMKDNGVNNIHTGFFIFDRSYVDVFVNYIKNTLLHDSNELSNYQLVLTNAINDLSCEFIPSKFVIWGYKFTILYKKYYVVHHFVSKSNNETKDGDHKQIDMINRYMNGHGNIG